MAQRRNCTRRHTLTTTALQLYVGNISRGTETAFEADANQRHRFPTLQLPLFTKMLSCTSLALLSRPPVP